MDNDEALVRSAGSANGPRLDLAGIEDEPGTGRELAAAKKAGRPRKPWPRPTRVHHGFMHVFLGSAIGGLAKQGR